jgi:hypothetical protein
MEVQAQVSVTTLPMDSKESVVVPKNGSPNRWAEPNAERINDRISADQVFLLLHQTAFGVTDPVEYHVLSGRRVGNVRLSRQGYSGPFQGIKLEVMLEMDSWPYIKFVYRRVMVKQDGTFSIGDLKRKVKDLQAIRDETIAREIRNREGAEVRQQEIDALLDKLGSIPNTRVDASVSNLQKEEIELKFNGLSVEEAKVLLSAFRSGWLLH